MIDKNKEKQIKDKISEFIRRIHDYENLDESEIVINPFLAEALWLKNKKDRVKFFFNSKTPKGNSNFIWYFASRNCQNSRFGSRH